MGGSESRPGCPLGVEERSSSCVPWESRARTTRGFAGARFADVPPRRRARTPRPDGSLTLPRPPPHPALPRRPVVAPSAPSAPLVAVATASPIAAETTTAPGTSTAVSAEASVEASAKASAARPPPEPPDVRVFSPWFVQVAGLVGAAARARSALSSPPPPRPPRSASGQPPQTSVAPGLSSSSGCVTGEVGGWVRGGWGGARERL